MNKTFSYKSKIWIYPGEAAWYFVSIVGKTAEEIRALQTKLPKRGFGSIRVSVTLGESSWDTSIFRENRSGGYLLPIKKSIRKKEGVWEGDEVELKIAIR